MSNVVYLTSMFVRKKKGSGSKRFSGLTASRFAHQAQVEAWYGKLAIVTLISILLFRLFPYDVTNARDFSLEFIVGQFSEDGLSNLKDYIELITSLIIFALLSFGLTGLLRQRRLPVSLSLGTIVLLIGGLSVVTEVAQAFLPGRNPNVSDVFSDWFGLLLGTIAYYRWRIQVFQFVIIGTRSAHQLLKKHLTLPTLATLFVAYLSIGTLGMVLIPFPTTFNNWDADFWLNLGNEASGDRPWQGTVSHVQLFGQAASSSDVARLLAKQLPNAMMPETRLAAYQFTQNQFTQTQTTYLSDRVGRSPSLVWQGSSLRPEERGISLDSNHWLQSATPVTHLNQQIQSTTELTLDVIFAPANLDQKGPARIVSVSKNPAKRNFTLGQDGKNLVFRLRTPITGENGSNPQMIVPDVFTDSRFHHVVVTYHNAALQIYVDSLDNLYTFQLPYLSYKLLYYGLIFIPLGSLLGMILIVMKGDLWVQGVVVLVTVFIPPLLLEGLLMTVTRRTLAWDSLILSWLGLGLGVWFAWRSFYPWLRREYRFAVARVSLY